MASATRKDIFHITHINNLPAIMAECGLWCDREVAERGVAEIGIAHQHIKHRRAKRAVPIDPGGTLADYVPFYFAPRSPMLYAIHRGSVEGYSGSQRDVVHLVSSVQVVGSAGLAFVFTDGHADMDLSEFFADLNDLGRIDWKVMQAKYWRDTNEDGDRKRRRQAEFLIHGFCPWRLVKKIGVYDSDMAGRVNQILSRAAEKPLVNIQPSWYY